MLASSTKHGLFRLGQPDQYVPPQYGWTVMVPALPPAPPKPGETPKPTPPSPWKPRFFDNDFRYLDKPDKAVHNTFDFLKRLEGPFEGIVSDFGGEFRWQARGEDNRRLTGEQNNFNLFRERLYLDTWYAKRFRTYLEVFWADASEQTVPPVFFDIDHGDLNNAFGELKLLDREGGGTLSARFGWKQELLFGNQRLVSPLDWANVRRTFSTVANAVYRSKNWDFDAFWGRPTVIYARQFDQPDYSRQFFGGYLTYKGAPLHLIDFYYLGLLETDPIVDGSLGIKGTSAAHTLGTRWQGERDNWLYEVEAAYQFGHQADLTRSAGMATGGFGRRFASLSLKPELWFFYDYASGDNPGDGTYSTFNQLFPLGHKYFGYMDIVGRQNVLDPNVNLKLFFGKRANLQFWYHFLQLASARDALYNAAGTPSRFDPSGRAGRTIGNELDIVLNYAVNPNSDWQIGFCQFWAGEFVENTATTPAKAQNANFFYTQFTVRF